MPQKRSDVEAAAGKLISAIQKVWGAETGESVAQVSEEVMDLAHGLLQARTATGMLAVLGERSVTEYLGELWVARHPEVETAIRDLEQAIASARA